MMVRVGLVQFDIRWEDAPANVRQVKDLLAAAEHDRYDLLVLPELWICGFTMNHEAWRTFDTGLACMQAIADTYDTAVLGGLPHRVQDGQENRCYLVTNNTVEHYAKMRVFKFAGEHEKYQQGEHRKRWSVAGFQLSPFICYDLRFPELVRPMMPDTNLITYVANWPSPREQHWRQLLVARAIENLSYVIGVNRIGRDGAGLDYPGASLVVDPTGKILLDAKQAEGIFTLDIDPAFVNETRNKFRFLDDMELLGGSF